MLGVCLSMRAYVRLCVWTGFFGNARPVSNRYCKRFKIRCCFVDVVVVFGLILLFCCANIMVCCCISLLNVRWRLNMRELNCIIEALDTYTHDFSKNNLQSVYCVVSRCPTTSFSTHIHNERSVEKRVNTAVLSRRPCH